MILDGYLMISHFYLTVFDFYLTVWGFYLTNLIFEKLSSKENNYSK